MLTAHRQRLILDRLAAAGQVSVTRLALDLEVSEDSIRRDLRDLAEAGLLQRVHGGALPASPATGSLARRETLSPEVKSRLGRVAAALVRPGQVVAIDGGTSNLQLVGALPADLACTVVTHSPLIAAALADRPRIDVVLVGGRLFRHSMVAVGAEAAEAAARVRTDLFFLGATGLHPDTGATTGDFEDAAVKRAFCRAAAEVVLLATPEKLGAASAYQIVPADQIAVLVVDQGTLEAEVEAYRARGTEVLRG